MRGFYFDSGVFLTSNLSIIIKMTLVHCANTLRDSLRKMSENVSFLRCRRSVIRTECGLFYVGLCWWLLLPKRSNNSSSFSSFASAVLCIWVLFLLLLSSHVHKSLNLFVIDFFVCVYFFRSLSRSFRHQSLICLIWNCCFLLSSLLLLQFQIEMSFAHYSFA